MNTPDTTVVPAAETSAEWDAILVRDLVRQAQANGHHPAYLELGEREANSFRSFLAKAYGEEGLFILKDTYYLGLEVVQVGALSHLAVTGEKTQNASSGDLPPLWADRSDRAA